MMNGRGPRQASSWTWTASLSTRSRPSPAQIGSSRRSRPPGCRSWCSPTTPSTASVIWPLGWPGRGSSCSGENLDLGAGHFPVPRHAASWRDRLRGWCGGAHHRCTRWATPCPSVTPTMWCWARDPQLQPGGDHPSDPTDRGWGAVHRHQSRPDRALPGRAAAGHRVGGRPHLQGTGIDAYFVGKPNPLMMRTALRAIDAHSEVTVMIGACMDTDISPAWRPAWGRYWS
jgi:hypothetical protein